MGKENRRFPRVKSHLKIGYEFVKWDEKHLDNMKDPDFAHIYDISVSGIGLFNLKALNASILKKLENGKLKVRLALYFPDKELPLITFARLIWSNLNMGEHHRYGFVFLDVSESFFLSVSEFVSKEIKKEIR